MENIASQTLVELFYEQIIDKIELYYDHHHCILKRFYVPLSRRIVALHVARRRSDALDTYTRAARTRARVSVLLFGLRVQKS